MGNQIENKSKPEFDFERAKLDFEKYKFKYNLFKWVLSSVVLVGITMLINYGLKDRITGLQELKQYDKYVTELIILNKDPGQKRMLAQFFSCVTPSEKLKKGWKEYFIEIDQEYKKRFAQFLRVDSSLRVDYYNLIKKVENLSNEQKTRLKDLEQKIKANDSIINPRIILPSEDKNNRDLALNWENKGFNYLLNKDIENAISAFQNSEDAYNQFHQVFEISQYLIKHKKQLLNPKSPSWIKVARKIAKDYSWKMPLEIKQSLMTLT